MSFSPVAATMRESDAIHARAPWSNPQEMLRDIPNGVVCVIVESERTISLAGRGQQ